MKPWDVVAVQYARVTISPVFLVRVWLRETTSEAPRTHAIKDGEHVEAGGCIGRSGVSAMHLCLRADSSM